jgi:hypothetical protein
MGVVLAGGARVGVDMRSPGAGVSAVVSVDRDGLAEALVAGPAEADGAVLAGLSGDGTEPGERGDAVR